MVNGRILLELKTDELTPDFISETIMRFVKKTAWAY